jgi:hypothetical protein
MATAWKREKLPTPRGLGSLSASVFCSMDRVANTSTLAAGRTASLDPLAIRRRDQRVGASRYRHHRSQGRRQS